MADKERVTLRLRWILLLSLVAGLLLTTTSHAQTQTLRWERFDVRITVLQNGDFVVEETQEIVFTSGQFRFGYRNIPMDRLEDITDVSVREGDRQYDRGRGGNYTFQTFVEDGDFQIRWYFPPTSNSSHTFVLRYTVKGGLRYYEDGDQLYWKAVYADRDFPVYSSTVRVELPDAAASGPVAAYDTEASIAGRGTSTVTFEAQETIDPGQEFEVRVQFPHGIVQGSEPDWQAAYDRRAAWEEGPKDLVSLGLGVLGALLLIGGPLGLLLLWYLRGRDPEVSLPAEYIAEPPSDDPPGVVGTLVDEKADMPDIIATLVDLARRGYLTIEEERERGFLGATSFDFTFRRTDKGHDDLLPHERRLLDEIFEGRSSRHMSDLRNEFYQAIPGIKGKLYQQTVKRGYLRGSPSRVRKLYAGIGVALLIGVFACGIVSVALLAEYTAAVVCPFVGVGVTAIGLAVVGQWMPSKTRKGAEQAARWEAFRRYLSNIEDYTKLSEAADQFERYLPYAIALGVDQDWVRKFSRIEDTRVPIPAWYFPTHRPLHTGGGRSAGMGRTAPTSRSAPSLQDVSDGLSGGLQSMSDGLTAMLNSAGSTLSSQPSSSGGGGGFSGGGGGGGGGGGFG